MLGTGLEERDFIYVDDVINAVLLVANNLKSDDKIFNVGTGTSTSIKKVVEVILGILDIQPEVLFTQATWRGDIKKLGADTERIRKLGFRPMYSLEDGLKETINWFNNTYRLDWIR